MVVLTSILLLAAHAVDASKVLSLPFGKRVASTTTGLKARQAPFSAPLNNYIPLYQYFATIEVGTPPQTIELILDTGSSDLWLYGAGACKEENAGSDCEGGEYDSTKSSTYKLLSQGSFNISYVTAGSGVVGDYVEETVSLNGVTLNAITIAVATEANQTSTGIMGIGLDTGEAITAYGGDPYFNFPDQLQQQGKIGTNAYSLYLDDLTSAAGILLFGGYDTAKYTGELKMLPLQIDAFSGYRDTFAIAWTSIVMNNATGVFSAESSREFPIAAILDSGTSLTYFPQELFDVIREVAGPLEYSFLNDVYTVSCDAGEGDGSLDFGFGGRDGPIISVPLDELVVPGYSPDGIRATDSSGEPTCIFGIQPNTDSYSPILLGQTFLRSAYVLYDLQNLALGLAPVVFDSTTNNIVEYGGSGAQPSITTISTGPTVTPYTEYPYRTPFAGSFTIVSTTAPVRDYPDNAIPTAFPDSLAPLSGTGPFTMPAPGPTAVATTESQILLGPESSQLTTRTAASTSTRPLASTTSHSSIGAGNTATATSTTGVPPGSAGNSIRTPELFGLPMGVFTFGAIALLSIFGVLFL